MHLFAYGTLCIPELMEKVAGRRFDSEAAVLPGYRSFLIKGHPYPGLIHTRRGRACGRLYYDIDPAALRRIDAFEGEYYRREPVIVRLEDDTPVPAAAYLLIESLHYLLSDRQWSEEEFRKRYLSRYLKK